MAGACKPDTSHTHWRTVHALQLERGASCIAVASCGTAAVVDGDLSTLRANTDAAISLSQAHALDASLRRQRQVVDAHVAFGVSPMLGAHFYETFTAYSNLVKLALEAMCVGQPKTLVEETFAKLKEELGKERGFVCGALAIPDEALPSLPSRAFADFVVCLHAQQAHLAALRDMASADELETVWSAVTFSAELSAVQTSLLRAFDVRGLRSAVTLDSWWRMMTAHIDGLHAAQQRLHSLSSPGASTSSLTSAEEGEDSEAVVRRAVRCAAAPGEPDGSADVAQLVEQLALVPAEAVKAQLAALVARKLPSARTKPPRPAAAPLAPLVINVAVTAEADSCAHLVPEEWRIGLDELELEHCIGEGAAGAAYRARWRASTVAVKVAHTASGLRGWKVEIEALMRLRHPNVVQLFGAVVTPPTLCLVLEFCEGGDVFERLQRPTPAGFALGVARGTAAGMAYLHGGGLLRPGLHRDLKSANLLLDAHGAVKVTDFGSATMGMTAGGRGRGGTLTAETGTHRWMSPEVINHERYSRPADVFSFAMVLFELVTHQYPFADRSPVMAAKAVAIDQLRPHLPNGTPAPLVELITSSWDADPARRPDFASLSARLEELQLSPAEQAWLDAAEGHPMYSLGASARDASTCKRPKSEAP